jgi:hypothetical protein
MGIHFLPLWNPRRPASSEAPAESRQIGPLIPHLFLQMELGRLFCWYLYVLTSPRIAKCNPGVEVGRRSRKITFVRSTKSQNHIKLH